MLAVQNNHAIAEITAMNAPMGHDPGSPFAEELRHYQAGTAWTWHKTSPCYTVMRRGDACWVSPLTGSCTGCTENSPTCS